MNSTVILLILCVVALTSLFIIKNFSANALAQFLNVNKSVENAEVLVVEGWVHNGTLKYVKDEFSKGSYKYILVSGMENGTVQGQVKKRIDSDASSVAQELIDMGIEPSKVKVSACNSTSMHRTFSMAVAAKKWLSMNDPSIKRINICTAWSHGRKTWCAYQRVFGDNIRVGILTYPKRQTPISQWFLKRGGLRYQLYSLAGYIYVTLWPINLLVGP